MLQIIGTVAGAMFDKKNRWRGGFVGFVVGDVAATIIGSMMLARARELQMLVQEQQDLLVH